jgi:hypothetical protein
MRCDQCQHWSDASKEWEADSVGFRKCLSVKARWNIQDKASDGIEWDSNDESYYIRARTDALKQARAYVQDGSEYRADLFTAPDFFCALFSATPTSVGAA